jgi:hypothetical protein
MLTIDLSTSIESNCIYLRISSEFIDHLNFSGVFERNENSIPNLGVVLDKESVVGLRDFLNEVLEMNKINRGKQKNENPTI